MVSREMRKGDDMWKMSSTLGTILYRTLPSFVSDMDECSLGSERRSQGRDTLARLEITVAEMQADADGIVVRLYHYFPRT